MHSENPPSGFTLIELLVVIAVVGILAALILPAVGTMKSQSQRAACQSNLKQLATAGLLFANDHDGSFPNPGEILNPFTYGGKHPTVDSGTLPLNAYAGNAYRIFQCPADTAPYPPIPSAPAWAAKPFYQTFGTSYFYNSYATTKAAINAGLSQPGLALLRLPQIKNPSSMVFFADQDARAYAIDNNWERLTLWWHAKPGSQLKANIAFVDGSVRFLDIRPADQAEFTFYNE